MKIKNKVKEEKLSDTILSYVVEYDTKNKSLSFSKVTQLKNKTEIDDEMESVYIEKASQLEAEEIKRILKNIL
jgi:hypothetical protein